MLVAHERRANYYAQNGSEDRLTPRQRRRVNHKANYQLTEAYGAREERSKVRAASRERRRARIASLLPL